MNGEMVVRFAVGILHEHDVQSLGTLESVLAHFVSHGEGVTYVTRRLGKGLEVLC